MRIPLIAAAVVLSSLAVAFAGDCPQWGGTNSRNMVSDEKSLPDTFDSGWAGPARGAASRPTRNVKWQARLGTEAYGNTAIAGGRVFIGTNNAAGYDPRLAGDRDVLLCLDEATGKFLWQLALPKGDKHGLPHIGICSHPTVEGDRVYIVTNHLEVLCLDVAGMANGNDGPFKDEGQFMVAKGQPPIEPGPTDADIIWRYDSVAELPGMVLHDCEAGAAMIVGDLLFVPIATVNKKANPAPALIVLDKRTGRLVARETAGIFPFHNQWSSPAAGQVGDKTLVFFCGDDGVVHAFDAASVPGENGMPRLTEIWKFTCAKPAPAPSNVPSTKRAGATSQPQSVAVEIYGTPVFYRGRIYFTLGRDPTLRGLEHGRLYCLDATKTGDVTQTATIWTFEDIAESMSTVAISDGLLFVADLKGSIYCLDAETGQLHWKHQIMRRQIWSSPLVADGKVYIATGAGRVGGGGLLVFAASKEKKLLSEVELPFPVCITPVAANGTLYVVGCGMLWAVK